jgi:hypothetical protein
LKYYLGICLDVLRKTREILVGIAGVRTEVGEWVYEKGRNKEDKENYIVRSFKHFTFRQIRS